MNFISHPTVGGPDGKPMRGPRQTVLWDSWSFSVDTLANGESYRLRRNDLPDWSVERFAGDPNDEFELTEADELRPYAGA